MRDYRLLFVVVLVAGLCGITGCSEPSQPDYREFQVVPTKIGNSWTWEKKTYDGIWQVGETEIVEFVIDTVFTQQDLKWYGGDFEGHRVYYNCGQLQYGGGYSLIEKIVADSIEDGSMVFEYSYPMGATSDSSGVPVTSFPGYDMIYEDDESILKVEAGEFNFVCYYIARDNSHGWDDTEWRVRTYLIPGVGIGKRVVEFGETRDLEFFPQVKHIYNLVDYRLN